MRRSPLSLLAATVVTLAPLAAILPAGGCSGNPQPSGVLAPVPADSLTPLAIRPGDVVRVVVWGHQELSGEFPIDENYNLLYPLVGTISVRSLSVSQLRDRLSTDLSSLFQRPFFTLTPLFRVAVLGEVGKPGLYSVDPTLTVFDLLALAGGPTRQANERKLQLIRGGENFRVSLEPAAIARSTLRELGVRSGDQLVVPRSSFTREDFSLLLQVANLALLAYVVFR